jgi:hypothetical protein
MATYRKKRILVEATQWFPGTDVPGVFGAILDYAYVETIGGQLVKVQAGDWVITEPDGVRHYPCDPAVFAATYERVDEGSDIDGPTT